MRKHGGWFAKDGPGGATQAHSSPWFAKDRRVRRRRAMAGRKANVKRMLRARGKR